MAMQMIVAGGIAPVTDNLRVPDADNPRGYYEFERVKNLRADKAWLDEARGKVVKSQATMLARGAKAGGALPPERLMAIYEQQLKQVHAWLAARPNFRVLSVRHADFIRDAAAQAKAIGEFLGGDLDVAAMGAAVDPSLHRNRS